MANCVGCGAVNDELALNCSACGQLLAVLCSQCLARNVVGSTFCNHCGRLLEFPESAKKGRKNRGSSVSRAKTSAVVREQSELLPFEPIVKIIVGGGVFAFLFLTQTLAGYPVAAIVVALGCATLALWGIIETTYWALRRFDQEPTVMQPSIADTFPAGVEQGFSEPAESFEAIDRDVAATASKLQAKSGGGAAEPEKLVTSMVSGATVRAWEKSESTAGKRRKPRHIRKPERDRFPAADAFGQPEAPVVSAATTASAPTVNSAEEAAPDMFEEDPDCFMPRLATAQTLAEFLEQGIDQEISSVERKIRRSPDNFALRLRLAQLYEERQEFNYALETMSQCIVMQSAGPEAFLYYGTLLRRAGDDVRAEQALRNAIALNPFLSKAHFQLGSLERSRNNLTGARDALQQCIQLSPDDPYAHYQLGMVYRAMGETSLATMELKRAIILNPGDSYGHSQLGQIYQVSKQLDQALHEYSQALALKPNDAFVLEKLAEVLVGKGQREEARAMFQEALAHQFHPEVRTLASLMRLLHEMQDTGELPTLIDEILRIAPDHPEALLTSAELKTTAGDLPAAEEILVRLVEKHPERWEGWSELGKIYQQTQRIDQAIAAFIKAAANADDQAGVWNAVGILFAKQKKYQEALAAFQKAVSFDYSDARIQSSLRSVRQKIEAQCNQVIEEANQALLQNPSDYERYLQLGQAYRSLDQPENALMVYQRVLSLKPDYLPGLLEYANLLKQRGKLRMAMRCYREILKIDQDHLDARLQLIQGHLNLGFINDAMRHAVVAQKIASDNPTVHFLLGKIYFAKGLAPRSLKEFTIVAQTATDPDMISWAELMRRRLLRS